MPIVILSEERAPEGDVDFIHAETGELTVEAQVISDFLTQLDLSAVSEVEGIDDLAIDGEVDNEDGVAEKCHVLPGSIVLEAIDEGDLEAMFRHYLNAEAERITNDPKASLESKGRLAPFVDMLDEKYKRGAFAKMHKGPAGHNRAARQMTAMLYKGVIKHVKRGSGQGKNKDYSRDKGYKTGGTAAGKKKVALFKGKNAGKIKRSAMKARQKVKESESFEADSTPVFGLAEPIPQNEGKQLAYVATLRADANERILEAKKGKGLRAHGKPQMPHPPKDACESRDDRSSRTVVEGAGLASKILNLNEARSGTMSAATKTT